MFGRQYAAGAGADALIQINFGESRLKTEGFIIISLKPKHLNA
jgi:hypothetical protein